VWLNTASFVRAQDDAAAMPFDNPSLAAQLVQVAAHGFTCREKRENIRLMGGFFHRSA